MLWDTSPRPQTLRNAPECKDRPYATASPVRSFGVTVNLDIILECHRQHQLKCPQSEPHAPRQDVTTITELMGVFETLHRHHAAHCSIKEDMDET